MKSIRTYVERGKEFFNSFFTLTKTSLSNKWLFFKRLVWWETAIYWLKDLLTQSWSSTVQQWVLHSTPMPSWSTFKTEHVASVMVMSHSFVVCCCRPWSTPSCSCVSHQTRTLLNEDPVLRVDPWRKANHSRAGGTRVNPFLQSDHHLQKNFLNVQVFISSFSPATAWASSHLYTFFIHMIHFRLAGSILFTPWL